MDNQLTGRRTTAALACVTGLVLAVVAAASAGPAAAAGHPSTVTDWNAAAGRAAVAACIAPFDDPLHESRMYAMTHLAVHDALNAIDRRFEPYAADFTAPPGASPDAAVAAAAHDTLVATLAEIPAPFPQQCRDAGIASVSADYAAALAAIPAGAAKATGVATGQHAAAAVLAERAGDGSDTQLIVADYPQGTQPGQWRFTPERPFAFAPGWGSVRTFGLTGAGQFRVAPPLPLKSARYAADVKEVKAIGGDGVGTPTRRTAEQTEIARFWVESSPLSWNRLARTLATSEALDGWEQARLYGLLNIALTDGYIASFDSKYDYRFWRPVTAIREAASDGNRATTADPGWTPLEITPPIPDHDSAHAVEGGAAAMVFRQFFGTDRHAFSHCSTTVPTGGCTDATPSLRHFTRFSQAAQENADSRVYIGFHFRHAAQAGLHRGEKVGRWVAQQLLQPLP